MTELPERVQAVLARVEAGESTVDDAVLLRQGLDAAATVVESLGFEDAAAAFRALFRLRAWFVELSRNDTGRS